MKNKKARPSILSGYLQTAALHIIVRGWKKKRRKERVGGGRGGGQGVGSVGRGHGQRQELAPGAGRPEGQLRKLLKQGGTQSARK